MRQAAERVLGIDACRGGWIGIALQDQGVRAYCAEQVDELVREAAADGEVQVVAIDMPIGLPDSTVRQADRLARQAVGLRASSVFVTPVRQALAAGDYAAANSLNREITGAGISQQAFGLQRKLAEVDRWVRRCEHRVVEVHPEVSFAELAGTPLRVRKATWNGAELRRRLLREAGIEFEGELGRPGAVAAVDDVLDAAVAAWTARRVAQGVARSLPEPPERFSDDLPAAIWA